MRQGMSAGLLALMLLAGTLNAQQSSPPPAPPGTAAISGVVVDGVSRQPLAGAIVELRAPSTGAMLARLTRQVTDDRGRFLFNDLSAGAGYTLQATRPGYVNGQYGQPVMFGPSGRVTLAEGQWFPSANITLWKPGAISGRVVDETNEPVVGAYVRALARVMIGGAPQLITGITTKTDDRGDYRLSGMAPGQYVVVVPSPSATVPSDAPQSVVGAPQAPFRMDGITSIPAPPRTNALLDPVGGYRAVVGNYATPTPAADGRARVYGMAFHPGVATVDAASIITLALGEERAGVDIALQPTPAVNVMGRVVGSPDVINGLVLRLAPTGMEGLSHGAEAATSLVRPDGAFAFLHVAAGDYVIDAPATTLEFTVESSTLSETLPHPPGLRWTGFQSGTVASGPPGTGYVRQSGVRTDVVYARTPITVGNSDMSNVLVSLIPSMTMHGRIEYEGTTKATVEQTPVGGIAAGGATRTTVTETTTPRPSTQPSIVAEPAFGNPTLGLPRADRPSANAPQDVVSIPGLRAGAYVLRVASGADRFIVRSVTVDGVDYTRKPIDTTVLTDRSELVITLTDKLIELHGTVSDDTGPAADAAVLAFPVERNEWRGYGLTPQRLKSVPLAGSPGFSLTGLPAGDYFVIAIPSAQMQAWQDPAFLEKAAAAATRVTLAWGEARSVDLRVVRVP